MTDQITNKRESLKQTVQAIRESIRNKNHYPLEEMSDSFSIKEVLESSPNPAQHHRTTINAIGQEFLDKNRVGKSAYTKVSRNTRKVLQAPNVQKGFLVRKSVGKKIVEAWKNGEHIVLMKTGTQGKTFTARKKLKDISVSNIVNLLKFYAPIGGYEARTMNSDKRFNTIVKNAADYYWNRKQEEFMLILPEHTEPLRKELAERSSRQLTEIYVRAQRNPEEKRKIQSDVSAIIASM